MKKKAVLILIIIALLVTVLFLPKAFAASLLWQLSHTASPYQAQPNSDARQPANPDMSGSWYSPMNPNNQPKYYWYDNPRNDGCNNAYRDWWCW